MLHAIILLAALVIFLVFWQYRGKQGTKSHMIRGWIATVSYTAVGIMVTVLAQQRGDWSLSVVAHATLAWLSVATMWLTALKGQSNWRRYFTERILFLPELGRLLPEFANHQLLARANRVLFLSVILSGVESAILRQIAKKLTIG